MISPEMEERAALYALGALDESSAAAFREEAQSSTELQKLVRAFDDSAACLAFDAPQVAPPDSLRDKIMSRLEAGPSASASSKIIAFPRWIPYALAACLMGVAIYQANEIFTLSRQVGAEHADAVALRQRDNLAELRLASLEAKDAAYVSAKVIVAWDPQSHKGVISIQNLPAAPAGHDYQLWVLDPSAPAPLRAGLLKGSSAQGFAAAPVRSAGPGFAISLEPAGGRPTPTAGAILFAVAPGS